MKPNINGWLNIYKPPGISSAAIVGIVKKAFGGIKIGHTGTLDVEAEGVLPLALGEATKLAGYLVDSIKAYRFKIQFGAQTDTADAAGKILKTSDYSPNSTDCQAVCAKFTGKISQLPPSFSALKIKGVPAYKLARAGKEVILQERFINIYNLSCLEHDATTNRAIYFAECSKGTYIRTLAEDLSFSLQTLGYVLELARLRVGMFLAENSLNFADIIPLAKAEQHKILLEKLLNIETILVDIPVLDIDANTEKLVRFGQKINLAHADTDLIWLRSTYGIVAIGKICQGCFISARVLN